MFYVPVSQHQLIKDFDRQWFSSVLIFRSKDGETLVLFCRFFFFYRRLG